MTIVIVDFSQTVISAASSNPKELKIDPDNAKGLLKHMVLNMLLSWKKQFRPSKMILACDAKSYWRKKEFPHYKGHRKHAKKDADFLDWDLVFETLAEIKTELAETFPYTVLEVPDAEADDIIGVLTEYYQENEFNDDGLIEEPHDIIIVSTDGDHMQLQKHRGVKQWNNTTKKFMETKNPKLSLIEKICLGDPGDNLPSIANDESWSKSRADNVPVRATAFKHARIQEFYDKGIAACVNDREAVHWKRNEKLIDYDKIPDAIRFAIINTHKSYEVKGTKTKVYNYLMMNRMKLLLSESNNF